MEEFRSILEECHLSDMGCIGSKYTWTNGRSDGTFTKERLDRAVANKEWRSMFKEVVVHVLAGCTSDHKPLLIDCTEFGEEKVRSKQGFKFEAKWMLDEECSTIIHDAWEGIGLVENPVINVYSKLGRCQGDLSRWSRCKFGNTDEELKKKTKRLEELQRDEVLADREEITRLKEEIDYIMEQEDHKWKQRAKQHWFKEGDRHTSFFHAWASHRRKINQIQKIQDEEGREWKKPEEIAKAFVNFYEGLFTSGGTNGVAEVLESMEPK
ncbi:uncharacterized protein LOC132187927 [Corylus avellana]|uniref:uncharacterized protein LOC132187927 n=1 Tax=Corylus avellana TaxID=13451 RepID=UPI00286C93A8|nr:uncharacterized protein LOC132187927 [Corylus avellana]